MGCRERRVYINLIPTLIGRETVSDIHSAQEKAKNTHNIYGNKKQLNKASYMYSLSTPTKHFLKLLE